MPSNFCTDESVTSSCIQTVIRNTCAAYVFELGHYLKAITESDVQSGCLSVRVPHSDQNLSAASARGQQLHYGVMTKAATEQDSGVTCSSRASKRD